MLLLDMRFLVVFFTSIAVRDRMVVITMFSLYYTGCHWKSCLGAIFCLLFRAMPLGRGRSVWGLGFIIAVECVG